MEDRLFIAVAVTGIAYCDRSREVDGDWPRIGFLPYSTLEPEIAKDCPDELRDRIVAHMAGIQARHGERYRTSTAGQTITLGHALPRRAT